MPEQDYHKVLADFHKGSRRTYSQISKVNSSRTRPRDDVGAHELDPTLPANGINANPEHSCNQAIND
ncbi:MAG: hypothetical protein ACI8W3_000574 [Myxococcota bacterium]|jgi:hypothetical protein